MCVSCMRIYQFIADVYSKLDENARNVYGKNPIFMGIDTKINDQVIAKIKRQLDRLHKVKRELSAAIPPKKRLISPISRKDIGSDLLEYSVDDGSSAFNLCLQDFESRQSKMDHFGSTTRTNNFKSTTRTKSITLKERDLNTIRPMSGANRRGSIDLSVVRDRNMIPEVPHLKKGPVFLPPVTVNEYIVQQKKLKGAETAIVRLPPLGPMPSKTKTKKVFNPVDMKP